MNHRDTPKIPHATGFVHETSVPYINTYADILLTIAALRRSACFWQNTLCHSSIEDILRLPSRVNKKPSNAVQYRRYIRNTLHTFDENEKFIKLPLGSHLWHLIARRKKLQLPASIALLATSEHLNIEFVFCSPRYTLFDGQIPRHLHVPHQTELVK